MIYIIFVVTYVNFLFGNILGVVNVYVVRAVPAQSDRGLRGAGVVGDHY